MAVRSLAAWFLNWSGHRVPVADAFHAESECIAATECVKEVAHVRLLLEELGYQHLVQKLPVFEDNSSCAAFASSLKNRKSAKHYEIRVQLAEQVAQGTVVTTKPLPVHRS